MTEGEYGFGAHQTDKATKIFLMLESHQNGESRGKEAYV